MGKVKGYYFPEDEEELIRNFKPSKSFDVVGTLFDTINHKQKVIEHLTDDAKLMTQRNFLNEIIRMDLKRVRERWRILYKEYEWVNSLNLDARLEGYNGSDPPRKLRGKLDYIDRVMGDVPGLYKLAVKLFESDFKSNLEKYRAIL